MVYVSDKGKRNLVRTDGKMNFAHYQNILGEKILISPEAAHENYSNMAMIQNIGYSKINCRFRSLLTSISLSHSQESLNMQYDA